MKWKHFKTLKIISSHFFKIIIRFHIRVQIKITHFFKRNLFFRKFNILKHNISKFFIIIIYTIFTILVKGLLLENIYTDVCKIKKEGWTWILENIVTPLNWNGFLYSIHVFVDSEKLLHPYKEKCMKINKYIQKRRSHQLCYLKNSNNTFQ